jgi:hypothetical protein
MDELTKNPCCHAVFAFVAGFITWTYLVPRSLPAERSAGIAILAGIIYFDFMIAVIGSPVSFSSISMPAIVAIIVSAIFIYMLLDPAFVGLTVDVAFFIFSAVILAASVLAAGTYHAMEFGI